MTKEETLQFLETQIINYYTCFCTVERARRLYDEHYNHRSSDPKVSGYYQHLRNWELGFAEQYRGLQTLIKQFQLGTPVTTGDTKKKALALDDLWAQLKNWKFAATPEDLLKELRVDLTTGRPLPLITQVAQNKTLEVVRTKQGNLNGINDSLRAIQESKKRILKKYKSKAAPAETELRSELNSNRSFLESYSAFKYSYSIKRAGIHIQRTWHQPATVPQLQDMINELNSVIAHIRNQARQPYGVQPYNPNGSLGAVLVGKVHTQEGWFLKQAMRKTTKTLFEPKTPKSALPHVGVEIEFGCKLSKSDIADLLYDAGLRDFITLEQDNSLRRSSKEDFNHEICVLAPEKNLYKVLERTCMVIQLAGGYVNKSCGLHVHLDMRKRNPEKCFKRLIASLPILYQIVPYERVFNKHCKRNPENMEWAPKEMPKGQVTDDRYWAINPHAYTRHKTIEVRLHSGTINALKIFNWVRLLTTIVDAPLEMRANRVQMPETLDGFIKTLEIMDPLASYLRERSRKFDKARNEFDEETQRNTVRGLGTWEDDPNQPLEHVRSRKCLCDRCIKETQKQNSKILLAAAAKALKKEAA